MVARVEGIKNQGRKIFTVIFYYRCWHCGGDGNKKCHECDGAGQMKRYIAVTVTFVQGYIV